MAATTATNIDIEVNNAPAMASLASLWEITSMINRGALTDSMMKTSFKISQRKFGAYVRKEGKQPNVNSPSAGGSGELAHVFEWGRSGLPLFLVKMLGRGSKRQVTYAFRDSKKIVPTPTALPGVTKHVFKKKAEAFENAKPFTINPINTPVMVFWRPGYNDSRDGWHDYNRPDVVFKRTTSTIFRPGGGKYENKFRNAFLTWWVSDLGAQGDLNKVAQKMAKSTTYNMALASKESARLAGKKAIVNSTDPGVTAAAKTNAQKAIKRIEAAIAAEGGPKE